MSKDWESEFANKELKKFDLNAMLDNLNDNDKLIIYNLMKKHKKVEAHNNGINKNKTENKRIVKDSNNLKQDLLLEFINLMFEKLGRTKIDELLEFKMVDRCDLINEEFISVFSILEHEILELFTKTQIRYHKKDTEGYFVNFIKYVCDDIGLKFKATQKNKYHKSKATRKVYYSIIN